jgi:DNA-binding transcriptional ArsR family regulator
MGKNRIESRAEVHQYQGKSAERIPTLEANFDVALFSGLGDQNRARIFVTVAQAREPLNVKAICEKTAIGQPTASKHLTILHQANWLVRERRQNQVFYRLNPLAVKRIEQFSSSLRQLVMKSVSLAW